jgi:hypothetical protein
MLPAGSVAAIASGSAWLPGSHDIALVGVAEHVELVVLRVPALLAELHHEVERAELLDFAAVLVAIRLRDQAPELPVETPGNVSFDPIAHAHRVEPLRGRRCVGIGRRRIDACRAAPAVSDRSAAKSRSASVIG